MMIQRRIAAIGLLFTLLFVLTTGYRSSNVSPVPVRTDTSGQVVIAAPVQVLLYAGDRFLAADFEAIRAVTLGPDGSTSHARYRIRSHLTVSQLNSCHEDNYYLGNAMLTWGGLEEQGSILLRRASECRFWDMVPPFFYGFNQYFFHRNIDEARKYIEIAAERSPQNATALKQMSIMMAVRQINDEKVAISFLEDQIRRTHDDKLKKLLEKRIQRLRGLFILRNAQKTYEKRFSKPLKDPATLVNSGILDELPTDPLGVGYLFNNDTFSLRTLKIQGMEKQQ